MGEGSAAEREERENSGEVEVAAMAALGGGRAAARARAGGCYLIRDELVLRVGYGGQAKEFEGGG